MSFLSKQFIDVIHWTEPGPDALAYRYPMEDMEIQTGARLIVRESQLAVFVNEGKLADVFGPGTYRLSTHTLPLLTNLNNWDKLFQSPFKSDVYFFSTRLQTDQRWGTTNPIVFREPEFGAIRLRGHGIYSYRIANAQLFHTRVSGTVAEYTVQELEGQLRTSLVAAFADTLGGANISLVDLAAHQVELGSRVLAKGKAVFDALGVELESFVIESLSLPDDLQRRLDERIGIKMVGNLGDYTQFQIAQSIPIAAANEGNPSVAMGAGLGMGVAMAQQIAQAVAPKPAVTPAQSLPGRSGFCMECGQPLPKSAKFCSTCGKPQHPTT
jgi:membrane protease subunit (stomatin/prohibitin family)